MSNPLTEQAKEALWEQINNRDDEMRAWGTEVSDHVHRAIDALWESGRGRFAESLATADVSKAYAAYLTSQTAQKGTK